MNIHWQQVRGWILADSAAEGERMAREQVEKFAGDTVKIYRIWLNAEPDTEAADGTILVWKVSFNAVVEEMGKQ